jgi:membrane protease subunit (stomatin/prohibitin family)
VSFREFVAGELIDIIEWIDDSDDTMLSRFSRPKNEIKNGAQLIVRPGQAALFVDQGDIADLFLPGRHELATSNLPLLSTLRGWAFGFESPFKADILFVNTRQFTNCKWGTANPVIVRDPALGPVRLRAFGTYAIRIADPGRFVHEVVGTNSLFLVDEITAQLRDLVVSRVSGALAQGNVSVFDLSTQYSELGHRVLELVAPQFQQYGLELTQLVVENVSLPAEVESAIDQRSKMGVLGDLDQYTKLQSADALRDAARNPSGGAAAGVGIGMGAAMASRAMTASAGSAATPSDEPPPIPVPQDLWYYAVKGERQGPVDRATIKSQIAAGVVRADTLVWRKGMSAWTRMADVADLT